MEAIRREQRLVITTADVHASFLKCQNPVVNRPRMPIEWAFANICVRLRTWASTVPYCIRGFESLPHRQRCVLDSAALAAEPSIFHVDPIGRSVFTNCRSDAGLGGEPWWSSEFQPGRALRKVPIRS
jgi:hypothetical protein